MLSVIIPVYNVEKYLRDCLDSVVNQTYNDLEIIIVNDGSTDNSQNIIDEFMKKDRRITCIKQNNQGISSARNAGLNVAQGRYITFLDSDDWIDYNTYNKMIIQIEKENADLVVCGVYDCFQDKKVPSLVLTDEVIRNKNLKIGDFFLKHVLTEAIVVWNKIYKREIIKDNNILFTDRNEILQEDFLFNFKYYLKVNSVVNISDKMVYYRIRKSSVSKSSIQDMTEKNLRLIEYMYKYIKGTTYEGELTPFLSKKAYSMFNISTYHTNNDTVSEIKEIILRFSENSFFNKNFPVKLQSISTKIILKYVIDSLIYYRAYKLAALFQSIRVKVYKKNKRTTISSFFE